MYIHTLAGVICLCLQIAEAKGKARISFSLAQATCTSAFNFARSNQIQRPSRTPPPNDVSCKTLMGNDCELVKNSNFEIALWKASIEIIRRVKTTRVAGGTDAIPHEFPHVVRLSKNGGHLCGGTILNENYVVTAAHCFYGIYDPGNATNPIFKITAGEHNIQVNEGTEQIQNLKSVMWHENYDGFEQYNDIALITLDKPFEFIKNVLPPKLTQPDYEPGGQKAIVIGWESLSGDLNASQPDILQKVDMTVLGHTRCFELYNNKSNTAGSSIIPGKVCISSEDGWKSACGGDSGGPLSIKLDSDKDNNNPANYLFIGISSHAAGCETDFLPNVFSVSKYLDWIKTHAV